MTKIFILGASGYIGGTVLQRLVTQHPDFEITALTRTPEKGAELRQFHQTVHAVFGDLDAHDIISAESAKADIILSIADCDHEGHVRAIYDGMAKNHNISYLIHTSGTGILTDPKLTAVGHHAQTELSDKLWDDVLDIKQIHSLPDENLHRTVDKIVQAPPNKRIRYCIVCPPTVYGRGTGPCNQQSSQVPDLIRAILKQNEAFAIAPGENTWHNVHVVDLAELYVILVNEALSADGTGGKADWGYQGYYFAEHGTHKWSNIAKDIGKIAHKRGLIPSAHVHLYDVEKVKEINESGLYQWGTNSRSKASRARTYLGWTPREAKLADTLEQEIVLTAGLA